MNVTNQTRLIAIQQPTFLPWLGWFDIADQADLLVLLDDVVFSKRSWQQRNRLRTSRGLEYITVPTRTAGRHGQTILEVEVADPEFASRFERTVAVNYSRTQYYSSLFPGFREALHSSADAALLSKLNVGLIEWMSSVMGIVTPWLTSSTLEAEGKRGEYLAALCEALDADSYISPAGAEAYLLEDRGAFDRRDIKVGLHEYRHPDYRQAFAPFIAYASTLDLLFNEGPRALEIIRSGRRPVRALGTTSSAVIKDINDTD